ncbi:unnamed protein product (macronuclear) [Paramecium tetraurelia]|uniref:Uncharacterized protein n=1 Tax=Paramecium tetraurelia TaxID=5888 RepID=A0D838_PARTE|nr:uncharacterized protein GSPATT00014172001 [Paramecium tetraurelia]CAK79205.1 unnamed protein product [Paramecium tetraurelia]|eukprot:XP_001446602.1 hypothetical protein (macronuclear) [Paramecium tetraurelia strain d4-2]
MRPFQIKNTGAPNTLGQEKEKNKDPVGKQYYEEFNNKDRGENVAKIEDKIKPNQKFKSFINQKFKPNYNQGKFERLNINKSLTKQNFYSQGELLDQTWVIIKLSTNQQVDIQQ